MIQSLVSNIPILLTHTVLLKILVSGPYKGNLLYFHATLIFGSSG